MGMSLEYIIVSAIPADGERVESIGVCHWGIL